MKTTWGVNTYDKTETVLNVADLKRYLIDAPDLNRHGSIVAVRTNRETVAALLLMNESVIRNGTVRYFQIKDIGLGVYEVKLREANNINTYMVDSWERQVVKHSDGGYGTEVF